MLQINTYDAPTAGDRLEHLVTSKRVVPPVPAGRVPNASYRERLVEGMVERDGSSGASCFAIYEDANGEISQRRISCLRLEGYGRIERVFAFCHERRATRVFRVDRIQELFDCATGEQLDPFAHFADLHLSGVMRVKDAALDDFARILVFLARCDGEYHPFEEGALEDALGRYRVRYGGDDQDIAAANKRHQTLAPDGTDLVRALGRLEKAPHGSSLARLIAACAGDIIDADGRHTPEELEWGGLVQRRLNTLAAG